MFRSLGQFLAITALLAFGLNAQCAFLCALEAEHPCCPQQRSPACHDSLTTIANISNATGLQHFHPAQPFEAAGAQALLPPLRLRTTWLPEPPDSSGRHYIAAFPPLRV